MTESDAVLAHVRSLELRLLDPAVRERPGEVERMLHPEFVEYGASGCVWERASIIGALRDDPGTMAHVGELSACRVDEDVVLVTYRTAGARASLRASLWLRDDAGWRVRFHQGTLIASDRRGGEES